MKTFILGMTFTFLASFANADLILCTRNTPNFNEAAGHYIATNIRTVMLINLDKKTVEWGSSGSINSVAGYMSAKGVVINQITSSSKSSVEKITDIQNELSVYETFPETYGMRYTITMIDELGGTATARFTLEGKDMESMSLGSGSWSNTKGYEETFAFCTTQVEL